ncbi:unnamed protein product [Peronospora belbahrii]|uniref:Secreted protein n=1 Tax=Peronospora belbahrii TaxID=622444 RepID=A0AAU9KMW3_9STRA|nr:unnamed protein product [Peronospora belbahrii]
MANIQMRLTFILSAVIAAYLRGQSHGDRDSSSMISDSGVSPNAVLEGRALGEAGDLHRKLLDSTKPLGPIPYCPVGEVNVHLPVVFVPLGAVIVPSKVVTIRRLPLRMIAPQEEMLEHQQLV